jgi:hypothetical protein
MCKNRFLREECIGAGFSTFCWQVLPKPPRFEGLPERKAASRQEFEGTGGGEGKPMKQDRCPIAEKQSSWLVRCARAERWVGIVILSCGSLILAQSAPRASRAQQQEKAAEAAAAPQEQTVATPRVPLVAGAEVEEQILTQPPEVSWDGKLLTIDTENSTLTDILLAVRSATGASVEIPSSAASERVALHIGPAPIRDVLSTLLYGTNFDYIIQASADDEDSLRSVIVTEHGKADDIVTADGSTAPSPTVPSGPGVRMMRGWATSGKTAFQANAEAALAEKAAAEASGLTPASDSSAASDNTSAQDAPAKSESASTNPGTDSQSASPDTDQPLAPATARVSAVLTNPSAGENSSGGSAPMGQMVQDLQRMYQQRQQIQADQNRALQNAQRSTN